MSNFSDIQEMHKKFNLGNGYEDKPHLLNKELADFRLKFLQEELNEPIAAQSREDLPEVIDGLVDLVVVALGTAELMGINWELHWNEVKRANMAKRRITAEEVATSKRKSSSDLVKPEAWIAPDHKTILEHCYGNK